MSSQPSPYSAGEQSAQHWRDLAEQRGQLLRDMTDKWAERRTHFVAEKRAMAERLRDFTVRERTLTRRISELERTLRIVWQQIEAAGPSETRLCVVAPYVRAVLIEQQNETQEAGVDRAGAECE